MNERDLEFSTRAGLVFLRGYVSSEWLQVIFEAVEGAASCEEYYVRMAAAWLIAECFIKFPEETLSYLRVSKLRLGRLIRRSRRFVIHIGFRRKRRIYFGR